MEDSMIKLQKIIAQQNQQMREEKINSENKELLDLIIRIYSNMFDKAMNYTNIIIVAGFAGLLTIWGYVQNFLHNWDKIASILAIVISLIFFIIWEIIKMITNGISSQRITKVLKSPPSQLSQKLREAEINEQKQNILFYRVWIFLTLPLTILPGLVGSIILVVCFIKYLFKCY